MGESLEKFVRIKLIQVAYREGCGEIEHGLVQSQQTLAHHGLKQSDAEPYGEHIGSRTTRLSQKRNIKTSPRYVRAQFVREFPNAAQIRRRNCRNRLTCPAGQIAGHALNPNLLGGDAALAHFARSGVFVIRRVQLREIVQGQRSEIDRFRRGLINNHGHSHHLGAR
jgi:hypothetical protein